MIRLFTYALLAFLGFSAPTFLFFMLAAWYGIRYGGYELFVVSIILDAYHISAGVSGLPLYTMGVGGVLLLSALLRPHIVFRA